MTSLSVVIITFNEENKIGQCLDSIASVADDVVVVDSFSTDKTQEICINKKARFIQHKFEGYIEQKNFAIEQSQFDHILSLDADECLSEELQKSILDAKNDWRADGYYMNRLSNYCGKWIHHCGWYPDKKIRLLDRRKGIWGGQNPHEIIIMNQDATIGYLKGDLQHYTIESIAAHKAQIEKYTTMSAEYMFNRNKKVIYITIPFRSAFKFLQSYILRLGFLDGYYGFIICSLSVKYTWLKYYKLWKLNHNKYAHSSS
jgi:glycosyltransferase involved in cell wall biosynthesis